MSIEKRIFAAIICIAAVLVAIPARTGAQELSVGGDLVSSYVWRGAYCGGVSIQPTLSFSAGGFSLTAWGSVGFTSPAYLEEFDFTAGYSVGGLSLAITDYWFVFRAVDNSEDLPDYFNYKDGETAHMFEGSAAYDFGPLALAWNTFFAGADVNSKGKRAYSTYIEASAPFKVGAFGLKAELGITPWDGLYADKFNVANIGITGSKEIKVTDSFGIPAFTKVIFNPAAKQTHFVFGISL